MGSVDTGSEVVRGSFLSLPSSHIPRVQEPHSPAQTGPVSCLGSVQFKPAMRLMRRRAALPRTAVPGMGNSTLGNIARSCGYLNVAKKHPDDSSGFALKRSNCLKYEVGKALSRPSRK